MRTNYTYVEYAVVSDVTVLGTHFPGGCVPYDLVYFFAGFRGSRRPRPLIRDLCRDKLLILTDDGIKRTDKPIKLPNRGLSAGRVPDVGHLNAVLHWRAGCRTLTRQSLLHSPAELTQLRDTAPERVESRTKRDKQVAKAIEKQRASVKSQTSVKELLFKPRRHAKRPASRWIVIAAEIQLLEELHGGPLPSTVYHGLSARHRAHSKYGTQLRTRMVNGKILTSHRLYGDGNTKPALRWGLSEEARALTTRYCADHPDEARGTFASVPEAQQFLREHTRHLNDIS